MNDLLKNIVLGLGIFFGVLKPDNAPTLQGRLFRDDERLLASLDVANAMNDEIENLILAGNTLLVRADATLNGEPLTGASHGITYDLKERMFILVLSEHAASHRTQSKEAAFILLNTFVDVPLVRIADLKEKAQNTLTMKISLEIPNDSRFDPMILWNYTEPARTWRWSLLTEIPR